MSKGLLSDEVMPRIDETEVLNDGNGMYAVVGKHEIVVARDYIQSNGEVSAHREAVEKAAESGKSLLMYVDQDGDWYNFDPEDLISIGWTNQRKGVDMLNFPIREGQRVDIGAEI